MKLRGLIIALAGIFAVSAFATSHDKANNAVKPDTNKVSYTIGFDMGKNFKQQDITVNPDEIFKGLQDAFAGKDSKFSQEDMASSLMNFQKQIISKRSEKFKKDADVNKKKGEDFLAKNKKNKNVVTLPSGLQYRVIEAGKGNNPTKTDTVTVEYTGKLIDGTVFDSTDKKGKPASFKVTRVIAGWTEALQLMKPGAKFEIFVPADLAYGQRGSRGSIGPNETLIFDIHLISVEGAKTAKKKG